MGNSGADLGVLLGIPEEIHHFPQLRLLLVGTGHIVESYLFPVGDAQHRPRLAEVGHGVVAVQSAHEDRPEHEEQEPHNQQRNNQIIG